MRRLLIVVPVHGACDVHPTFIEGLVAAALRLKALSYKVLFIRNAAANESVVDALNACVLRVGEYLPVELILVDQPASRIAAINYGLAVARRESRDVVLLDTGIVLQPEVFLKLQQAAYSDPLIGFVSPRSNDSQIGAFPSSERFAELTPLARAEAHITLRSYLPEVTYVPFGDSFCLFIKGALLVEFGLLDESHSSVREAGIDYMMSCNRRGYRTVLANQAFALRRSSAGGAAAIRSSRLVAKYPELPRALDRYHASRLFRYEDLIAGLLPDRSGKLRVLFECSQLGSFFNGTFKAALNTIEEFVERSSEEFLCCITANRTAFEFHNLHRVANLHYVGELSEASNESPFAVAIRLAQPFSLSDLVSLGRLAPVAGFVMLDTIAMDCQYLDEQNLSVVWEQMVRTMSFIGYISEFTRDQFRCRFDVPATVTEAIVLLSTDPTEYEPESATPEIGDYVLLVGNEYSHKHVFDTVKLYKALPNRDHLVVFGVNISCEDGLTSYESGSLGEETVSTLFSKAKVVLYPSHYEGFGFPVITALAHRKPVVARKLPVFEEIRQRIPGGINLYLFDSTIDMVRFAATAPLWIEGDPSRKSVQCWADTADALKKGLYEACGKLSLTAVSNRLHALAECERIIAFENDRVRLAHVRNAGSERSEVPESSDRRSALGVYRYLTRGAVAWLCFRPGSRPRRALETLVNVIAIQARDRPAVARAMRSTLKYVPGLHQWLRLLATASGSTLDARELTAESLGSTETCALHPSGSVSAVRLPPEARLSPNGRRIYTRLIAQYRRRLML